MIPTMKHLTLKKQILHFMAMVEDISSGMDVETIIIFKNITNPIIIELLRKIAESKKPKTQQSTMMCEQSTVQASLKQPSSNL
jgi:hypothetical protein